MQQILLSLTDFNFGIAPVFSNKTDGETLISSLLPSFDSDLFPRTIQIINYTQTIIINCEKIELIIIITNNK